MILMQQMKVVFCKRLAACLCMQQSPSPSPERPIVNVTRGDDDDLKTPEDVPATKKETAENAPQENRNHLEAEMKHDWMLATAVLDRIFAITFTIIYFGGTLVVAVIIATHA